MKIKYGDAIGMLNYMQSFNVTTRGVDKMLDAIESALSPVVPGGVESDKIDEDTEVDLASVSVFTQSQYDDLVEGVLLPRSVRKRLEYLLVMVV